MSLSESPPAHTGAKILCSTTSDHTQIHQHLADGLATGLRRAISQVSMLVGRATSSGEAAWQEECQRYKQTRFSSRRVRKRVVFKHGDCNVVQGNVAKRRRRYLQDIFTTLVDAQWRWTLLVFAMTFLLSWLGFALVWWLVVYAHGDLDQASGAQNSNATFVPCVEDIHGFTSCFLFSVETQHTIGYGSKHTTEECPEAIFIMCIQSMTGVILQAFMVGIVFAKLSRPKKRTQTLLFSRNAVICQRDGQSYLMFRVGDMRKSHIIEAHVRAQMIKRKVTREGELLPFFQTELKVGGDGDEDKILFIWPTTIVHKINESSPLYHLSASDMLRERFEIIVLLEGVIESTGMTTQARSSYLPSEILWGHRFEHIITFRKETGEYEVNYTLFNNTYEVDTPLCSAAELDHVRALHTAKGDHSSSATIANYRFDSSSSISTDSGKSFSSSASGLQIRMHTTTPPTPIPVTITGPEDPQSRRGSGFIQLLMEHARSDCISSNILDQDVREKETPTLRMEFSDHESSSVKAACHLDKRNSEEDRGVTTESLFEGTVTTIPNEAFTKKLAQQYPSEDVICIDTISNESQPTSESNICQEISKSNKISKAKEQSDISISSEAITPFVSDTSSSARKTQSDLSQPKTDCQTIGQQPNNNRGSQLVTSDEASDTCDSKDHRTKKTV